MFVVSQPRAVPLASSRFFFSSCAVSRLRTAQIQAKRAHTCAQARLTKLPTVNFSSHDITPDLKLDANPTYYSFMQPAFEEKQESTEHEAQR